MSPIRKWAALAVLGSASLVMAGVAAADEFPLRGGDYWEVTGIDIKDGGGLKYAEWLASEWKANMEFSKSKGWIKGYKIFYNVYARAHEPDMYLVTITDSIVSGPEGEKRGNEFREWKKKTIQQMVAESGNRTEYRDVMSDSLLQEASFR